MAVPLTLSSRYCHRLYFPTTSFKVCVQGYPQVRTCEHQRHRNSWI
ncbi:unnamed protein product [Brassica rapa subsp. trilocularis]